MKKFLTVLLGIATVMALLIGGMVLFMGSIMKSELDAFDPTPIDISTVKDGTYEGSCSTTLVKVKVSVTVKDGKLETVDILEHQCGKGKIANSIAGTMVQRNNIEVDTVSGATFSSEVIKAAVRDALRN